MPIVKISAKSRHGFVISEIRGTVIPQKGLDVDTESKLYEAAKVYVDKGILVMEGAPVAVKKAEAPVEKVVTSAPVEIKITDVPEVEQHQVKSKGNKKGKNAKSDEEVTETEASEPAEENSTESAPFSFS